MFKFSELASWKKKRLIISLILYLGISVIFITSTSIYLFNDADYQNERWTKSLTENQDLIPKVEKIGKQNNTPVVSTGVYVENIPKIDLRNNEFDLVAVVWFRWTGHNDLNMKDNFRIYKGDIVKSEVLTDYHSGNENYQKVRISVNVTKNFNNPRFPLEDHQIHIYLEPNMRCDQVILRADKENSGINGNLEVSGYKIVKNAVATIPYKYDNTQNDPILEKIQKTSDKNANSIITTEVFTNIEIERDGWGLYLKCFIAMFATNIWVLITLYLASVHEVNPLSMIPGAFFGAVSNILVGANLLPDALEAGLIEFANIWGIFSILACAGMIISINSIRDRFDAEGFAKIYGRIMFGVTVPVVILGNLIMAWVSLI